MVMGISTVAAEQVPPGWIRCYEPTSRNLIIMAHFNADVDPEHRYFITPG